MKTKLGIVESAMKHWQIILLVVGLLVLFGVFALIKMPRQEFPVITIRQGLVIGVYPGATSSMVEEQLTDKVEKYLFGFKEIKKKKTYSVSKEGIMIIFVELSDNVKDADEFWSKLNHGLTLLKTQLPTGVMALFSDSDFGDTSALLIALESDHSGYRELESYLDRLDSRLRTLEPVSKIRRYGLQKEQITVYLEPEKLTNLGMSSTALLANLFTQGLTTSSGTIKNNKIEIPVHLSESFPNEECIANQIIYSDPLGNIIRLKDVARIVREYPVPESYIENNGKKCLLISMEMQEGNNIVEFGREVDQVLQDFREELPDGISISRIADQPGVVRDSIKTFLQEFLFAILAVILVTMLLLPFRAASVSAASIPITVFISIGIMYLTGMELNTVTLAALIVVLGMIVDNSVIIVDSYMDKLDHSITPWNAAITSAQGFFKAILSATLAISITFFPFLLTLKGTFRDFVLLFPWTVTLSLGISLLVAMLVIPFLQYFFIKKGFKTNQTGKIRKRRTFLEIIQKIYDKLLLKAFKHPGWTIGMGVLAVVIGIVLFTKIPQRLMPLAERNQFAVEIYLPRGSALEETARVADSLEEFLKKDKKIVSITSFIGTSSPRFHTTYAPQLPSKNYAQFIVNAKSNRATEELLDKYSAKYAHYFPNAYVKFKQLDYQPVAAPIEIRFSGEDIGKLTKASKNLMVRIRDVKGISSVRTNFEEFLPGVLVTLDATEANRLGINKSTVAANLALNLNGLPVTTLWENKNSLPVVIKTEDTDSTANGDIANEYIHSVVPGISVPLRQIATVSPDWNQGQIVRRNGVRTITVMADVTMGTRVNDIFPEIRKIAEGTHLENGVSMAYGGAYESDNDNISPLITGLMMSVFIIFLILVFHFKKINLALLVLLSSSLTILGATLGGLIMGVEFGITSILGVVSVIGILVRNGIIMMDYAEELRIEKGFSVKEAALEAGKRRMRPIFLTSAAASMGVIPMVVSKSALWAPMGVVISFGTILSMVLIVFILPVIYWLIFRRIDTKKANKTTAGFQNKIPAAILFAGILSVAIPFLFISPLQSQNRYSLEDCKRIALENNAKIKNSNLEVEASRQIKRMAFTKYFPDIKATGLAFKAKNPLMNMNISGGNLPVFDGNPVNLITAQQFAYFPDVSLSFFEKGSLGFITAVQPLFAGGRIITGNELARLGMDVNIGRGILSRNEVILKTEEQYWQVVSLKEKMKTLVLGEKLLDTLYKQANDAWSAGLINRNDVMKVMLKQGDLKVDRMQLENGIYLSILALNQTMGTGADTAIQLVDTLSVLISPATIYVNPEQALENRQEYKLLQQSIQAEELQTRMKIGEYLPEVGVGIGSYYTDLFGDQEGNTIAFATARIPISGWWEASYNIKERKLREEIARNNSKNASELLSLQIQQTWLNLWEAYKQVEVSRESIKQAEENLRINRDNYLAGTVNISDMLEAQMILQQSRNHYTDALVAYNLTMTRYKQMTGRYQ